MTRPAEGIRPPASLPLMQHAVLLARCPGKIANTQARLALIS
ncbi:MAG: hypothetical protein ABL858_06600 [Candidatus Nitrotoga sp.]